MINGPPNELSAGSLRSWVRTIGVRTCRRLLGQEWAQGRADGGLEQVPAAVADPEIDHLKSLYRDEFQTAFSDALGALTERERNVPES